MGERERQVAIDRFRALGADDRAVALWAMLGHPIRPWTEAQEVAALLGILQCPEGHQADFAHFYVDGTTHLVVDTEGKVIPASKRFEKQESFDVPHPDAGVELDGMYCEVCGRERKLAGFHVPKRVLDQAIFTEGR